MAVVLNILNRYPGKTPIQSLKWVYLFVLIWPEIRELICDEEFKTKLGPSKILAWQAFLLVVHNFLDNSTAENYVELTDNMLKPYQNMWCRMWLKMNFFTVTLTFSANPRCGKRRASWAFRPRHIRFGNTLPWTFLIPTGWGTTVMLYLVQIQLASNCSS